MKLTKNNKRELVAALASAFLVLLILIVSDRFLPKIMGNLSAFGRGNIVITRADGLQIPLHVEVATTDEQQARGLMFRKSLPHDSGMIFVQPQDKIASFWMKNTLIPLDILFVRRDGVVAQIERQAVPMDETPIVSTEPVRATIEINGGDAAALGIKTGDKVSFSGDIPVFEP